MNTTDRLTARRIAAAQSASRAERRLRILKALAEAGMEVARGLQRQAMSGNASQAADAAAAFPRVARAIRLTIMLEARLAGDLDGRRTRLQPRRTTPPATRTPMTEPEAEDLPIVHPIDRSRVH